MTPQLRELDPTRIRLRGPYGHFPLAQHLETGYWLPFQEPAVLDRPHADPANWRWYDESRMPRTPLLGFLRLLDDHGLLHLAPGPRAPHLFSRPFATYKDVQWDRLLVDKRGQNCSEARFFNGASTTMPAGVRLAELAVQRYTQRLVLSSADRSDMYHQAQVTRERADRNALGPAFSLADFARFPGNAVKEFEVRLAAARLCARERSGDAFLLGKDPRSVPRFDASLPVAKWPRFKVRGALCTLPMGEHCGVDFAQSAHMSLLRSGGLLVQASFLDAREPAPSATDVWEVLVIDDYVVVGIIPVVGNTGRREDLVRFDRALHLYEDREG